MFSANSLAALSLSAPLLFFLSRQIKQGLGVLLSLSFVTLSSVVWHTWVSQTVPQPYLDEIFHIPQAQKYCEGNFLEWDDKITTPPGLYLFSVLLQKAASATGMPWMFACGADSLRLTNVLGLVVLASLALLCRHEVESCLDQARSPAGLKITSTYATHTAMNIALFPLLFFFSGLYYTDVISMAVVMGAFLNHLKRAGRDQSSWGSDFVTIFVGIATLSMRQTNVFWVVIWMGGLEVVHAIKTMRPQRVDQPFMKTLSEQLRFYAWRYSVGDVHDPPLALAWPDDMLATIISFSVAVLCNPIRVLRQVWPYISLLVVFAGFVAWNGGVVLGDKSNHVATIHLAQMLYIWPLFAFFSLPLFLPYAVLLLNGIVHLPRSEGRSGDAIKSSKRPCSNISAETRSISGKQRPSGFTISDMSHRYDDKDPSSAKLSPQLPMAANICYNTVGIWALYIFGTLAASAVVIKFNTIIHPFTLADNRHYMFYIFRYTIRRGSLVRYMLIIPYTLSRWIVWGTVAGYPELIPSPRIPSCSSRYSVSRPGPFTSNTFRTACASGERHSDAAHSQNMENLSAVPSPEAKEQIHNIACRDPLSSSTEPVSTSTGLIFLFATALSLITAPLVEPRYFIIPWVMWRLLVPAWRAHDHRSVQGLFNVLNAQSLPGKMVASLGRYDARLVLETIWFMTINMITGYIFLVKPYVWKDENGQILDGGRLQRFMW